VTITIGRGVGWLCGTQTNSDQGNVRKNDRLYNASVTLVTDREKSRHHIVGHSAGRSFYALRGIITCIS
jgi:hypothetical protein